MQQDQKVDYIELPGENFDALEAFYAAAFGWSFTDYGPEYRAFSDGKVDGGFYASPLRSTTETGAALVILYARELEVSLDRVRRAGGKIARDVFSFPGGRRFHFIDPHGNELAVWSDT